ncbi:unnamed protein product [Spodoptera littoralis]|uniref:Uncharacterized protein n=1 Tax=Spodoptera littoralis TaxID=7109 RepID=A0A9P0IF13_SPOLI|nr:unnamed protein product [Spodoptera littoralis]CAH1643950.1 unnamed protein product [Spodoptera littoralis]
MNLEHYFTSRRKIILYTHLFMFIYDGNKTSLRLFHPRTTSPRPSLEFDVRPVAPRIQLLIHVCRSFCAPVNKMADEPTPGSSKDSSVQQQVVPRSAPEKLHIIRHVAKRLKFKPNKVLISKTKYYDLTGLHPDHLQTISETNLEDIEIKTVALDRSQVHRTWVSHLSKNFSLPTTEQLFWQLKMKVIPIYMNLSDFRTWLYKNDFMWERGSNGELVVVEKTEVRFERYLYLQKMARYREENKQIFFIGHGAFNSEGRLVTLKESNKASKNNNEIYQRILFAVSAAGPDCLRYVESFTEKVFLDWINQVFLIAVGTPSVVVLSYDKHHCEEIIKVPTLESSKRDLCKWLDYFGVPYDAGMTKVILHDLIEKYTDLTEKIYAVDAVLKANGHTVLRIPNCIRRLTPATFYPDMVDLNVKVKFCDQPSLSPERIRETIDAIFAASSGHMAWVHITSEEKCILAVESSVDKMINKIKHTRMKTSCSVSSIVDSDIPSDDSDSE